MKTSTSATTAFRRSAAHHLREMAQSFGFVVDVSGSLDIDFHPPIISLGRIVGDVELEERLAHELGHFIMAPKYRRRTHNFGHESGRLSADYADREELAASVLGMLLQRHFRGTINMGEPAYLWNWSDAWRGIGFWVGARVLVEKGWMIDGFNISIEKLTQFCKEEARGQEEVVHAEVHGRSDRSEDRGGQ